VTEFNFERKTCEAMTVEGTHCRAHPMDDGSGLCVAHNPAVDEDRKQWTRKGGKATRKRKIYAEVVDPRLMRIIVDGQLDMPLETLDDLKAFAAVEVSRLKERSLDKPPTIAESTLIRLWIETLIKLWERGAILDMRDQVLIIEARQEQLALDKGITFTGDAKMQLGSILLSEASREELMEASDEEEG